MDLISNNISFEANGGNPESNSWSYKLNIKTNNEFQLNFNLRQWMGESNWSDASVDDWTYEGNFTLLSIAGIYNLTFTNIFKSGTSQANGDWSGPKPIPRESYTKGMSAKIRTDGSCDFKKEKWGVAMKSKDDVAKFFISNYNHIETIEMDVNSEIDNMLKQRKNCCSIDSDGYIDCGVPCRGRCCIDGMGSFCSSPCDVSSRINTELRVLYTKKFEMLSLNDLDTPFTKECPAQVFDKIIINRLKTRIPTFSNCNHQEENISSWSANCVICKSNISKVTQHYDRTFADDIRCKYLIPKKSSNYKCLKCPYEICTYCRIINEKVYLDINRPLHDHEIPFTSKCDYESYRCDFCAHGFTGERNHCPECKFDVCPGCYSNYEKYLTS